MLALDEREAHLLHKGRLNVLLLVEGLQARESLLQDVLSGALLRNGRLELLVLRLPLLARDLRWDIDMELKK